MLAGESEGGGFGVGVEGRRLEGTTGLGDVGAALRRVVEIHSFAAAFFFQGVDHVLDLGGGEEGPGAECAGADALFHADYFTAVEAVGCGGEERVSCGLAVAAAFGRVGGCGAGEGRVRLDFEGTDCGVEVVEGGRGPVHGGSS